MRLFFPNTARPKKAAKYLAQLLDMPLARTQRAVARACDYLDWHDLEGSLAASPPSPLDQDLTYEDFIERHTRLSLTLADTLAVPNGDAQYALAGARLTGDRPPQIVDQIAIRLACFRATVLPQASPRMPGAVGKLKTPGRNGEVVVLRQFGRSTQVISNQAVTTVADFEYVSPRVPPPLFMPMRLYLPYGFWTENDGAQVVFSRDYKPLWRVREDGVAERLQPWLWIRFRQQTFLWDDAKTPWYEPQLKADLEGWLTVKGITGLPILADALPPLVKASAGPNLSMTQAAELLQRVRNPPLSSEAL